MSTTSVPTTGHAANQRRALDPARKDRYRGLLAGLAGALAMIAVFIALRGVTDSASVIDTLADATLLAMPIGLFSFFLETFGPQAKTLFLVGLVAVLALVGGGLGQLYAVRTAGARRPMWARAQAYAVGITVVLWLFLLLIAGEQTAAAVRGENAMWALLVVFLGAEAWAVVTTLLLAALRAGDASSTAPAEGTTLDRRRALTLAGAGAVTLASLGVVGREVQRVATRKAIGSDSVGVIPPAITPTDEFYVISKNFMDPSPDRGDDWSVEVGGLVETPGRIGRADLEALGAEEFVSTLTCISNEVGGPLISTARWTGVPLATVLKQFGVRPNAVDLVAEGEDGYTDSIPIAKAMAPETHLVWAMNGEPLPRSHGEPVRLIVPGLYGIKNVKWLTKLTISGDDYEGYWQERGWTDEGIIKTQSQVDVPRRGEILTAGSHEIGGTAFAGDRGVRAVEVSFDGGDSWRAAEIAENPSDAGLSWVVWRYAWDAKPGSYQLAVRATDGEGTVQTADEASTLPDGASGYHRITVGVA